MTVKELKDILRTKDDDMVVCCEEYNNIYTVNMAREISKPLGHISDGKWRTDIVKMLLLRS